MILARYLNPYTENDLTRDLLTSAYGQFIMDQISPPSAKIIESSRISIKFLKVCYEDALNHHQELLFRKWTPLIVSHHQAQSSIFSLLPKEIFLHIFEMDRWNFSFDEFHRQIKDQNLAINMIEYLSIIEDKGEDCVVFHVTDVLEIDNQIQL